MASRPRYLLLSSLSFSSCENSPPDDTFPRFAKETLTEAQKLPTRIANKNGVIAVARHGLEAEISTAIALSFHLTQYHIEVGKKDNEIGQLQERLRGKDIQHESELEYKDVKINRLKETHESELKSKDVEFDKMMERLKETHKSDLKAKDKDIAHLNETHESELKSKDVEFDKMMERLKETHKSELKAKDKDIANLNETHALELKSKDVEYESALKAKDKDIAHLNETHESELKSKDVEFDKMMERLKETHKSELKGKDKDIAHLNETNTKDISRLKRQRWCFGICGVFAGLIAGIASVAWAIFNPSLTKKLPWGFELKWHQH